MKLIVTLVVVGAAFFSIFCGSICYANPNYADGELLVWFNDQYCPISIDTNQYGNIVTGLSSIDSLLTFHDCVSMEKSYKGNLPEACGLHLLKFPLESDMEQITADFAADSHVSAASPNFYGEVDDTPDDPYFPDAQICHDMGSTHMMSEKGWEINEGSSNITIAVIDLGVDYLHPDLKENIWVNPGEDHNQSGTFEPWAANQGGDFDGVDNDTNGYVDDVIGYDFSVPARGGPDGDPFPFWETGGGASFTHGTMVAGAAAAVTNNGIGIAGTSWNSKIMVLKLGALAELTYAEQVANAVLYAVENGADIINMSLGFDTDFPILRNAVNIAYHTYHKVLVASAGNDGLDTYHYPASYDSVIGVASATADGHRCSISNYGHAAKVAATVGNWLTHVQYDIHANPDTLMHDYVGFTDEDCATSFTAPLVSGLAALIWSTYPNLTNRQVMDTILNPVNRSGIVVDPDIGGTINVLKCLSNNQGEQWFSGTRHTWQGTIYLSGDIVVGNYDTLVIQPGTVIQMVDHDFGRSGYDTTKVELVIQGTLIAVSEDPNNPIVFTAAGSNPQPGHWYGIRIDSSTYHLATRNMKNCRVEYAYAGIDIEHPAPSIQTVIEKTRIQNCSVYGINTTSSNLIVRSCHIENIGIPNGYGIYCSKSSPLIASDTVIDCYYGIFADSCFSRIDSSYIQKTTIGSMGIRKHLVGAIPADSMRLIRSKIAGSFYYGVYNYRGRMRVDSSCTIDGATYAGISNTAGSSIKIRRSNIINYQNFGVLNTTSGSSADLGIHGENPPIDPGLNNIYPTNNCNKKAVAILYGANSVMAEDNYWGTFKGPQPCWFTAGVDYNPWLTEHTDFYMPRAMELSSTSYELLANHPNPFNSQTVIQLTLPQNGKTLVTVYNILGQKVRTLLNEELTTGRHEIVWDGTDDSNNKVASGVYFYQVRVADYKQSRKMVFLH